MPSRNPNRHPDRGLAQDAGIRMRHEDGFTLIELLVAVAILATLVTLVSLSFSSTFTILEAVEEEQGRVHQARLCLNLIADELIMARRKVTSPWIGRNGAQNGQPSDFLTFVSTSHVRNRANAPETDLIRVLYAREGTRLLRFARPNLYELPQPLIEQMELAQGVVGFNLRYYDRALSAWVDEWDDRTRSELPTAIMIELILGNAHNEPRTFTEWVTLPGQAS